MAEFCKLHTNEYNLNDLHFDLQAPMVSYDHHDNDSDPSTYEHEHGTSVSGIVGAAKNSTCGIGIAYKCNLGSKCVRQIWYSGINV